MSDVKKYEKINLSLTAEENRMLSILCKETNLTKSEIIRRAIKIAICKRDKLKKHIENRKNETGVFDPQKDSFNTTKFIKTFINLRSKELEVGLLINVDDCRISLEKGVTAYLISIMDKDFLVLEQYRPKVRFAFQYHLDISEIKDVKICNVETDTRSDYYYMPPEDFSECDYYEILC